MARWPGTERSVNRAGWHPGSSVRALRTRANGALDLADRRGFVTEVRPAHVRVYFGEASGWTWLANEACAAVEDLEHPALESLRRVHVALAGERMELEDGHVIVFGPGYPLDAATEVRTLLGRQLSTLEVESFGVHELATRLGLDPLPE